MFSIFVPFGSGYCYQGCRLPQKGRCSADVFARLKSFGRAFSKARASGGGVRLLAVAVHKTLVILFQKRRCLADVFACFKSFGRAFSKARAGGGRGALLAVATAKCLYRRFFLLSFFFAPVVSKKKRVGDSGEVHGYR